MQLPPSLPPGQITVSQMKNGKGNTLHQVGRCWRVPGVHYMDFRLLSVSDLTTVPKDLNYQRVCRDCFPRQDESSSSDSSSDL